MTSWERRQGREILRDRQETYGGGRYARIEKVRFCPTAGYYESPHIKTVADSYAPNNLDNLPGC